MNVLDCTSIVIPVTTASAKIDLFDKAYKPFNEKDKVNWEACKFHHLFLPFPFPAVVTKGRVTDDPEKYDGGPAAIQLMGHRLDEERLLSIAQILVNALEEYQGGKLVA